MRSEIALLLVILLATGGCDKQSRSTGQATTAADAPNAASEVVEHEVIGTLDRSHKGAAAPDYAFENPAGAKVTLADFKGRPVLLNLWATWCAPCVREMPTLDKLATALGDKVQVLTVSQDLDGAAKVDPWFQKAGLRTLQPYLDPDVKFSTGLGVNLPTTILYDAKGHEVWRMTGGMDWTGHTARELVAEAG